MSQQRPAEILQMPTPKQDPPAYYTDSINCISTPVTVMMTVARLVGATKENTPVFKPECVLYMSPQHMKSMWLMLGRRISSHEENYGEIVLPDMQE